jgi:hypothetical protein
MSINPPDIDPANNNTLSGAMRFAFQKFLQGTDGMLPAKVIAFKRSTNRVTVQLMITVVTTGGTQITRPQVASVPVLQLGGGGVFLGFNLVPGNLGWLCANDRDISLFLQDYVQSPPNTGRIKNFADGVFIPAQMTNFTINAPDADNAVLSTADGTIRLSIGANGITLTSPPGLNLTAPLTTVTGAQTVTGVITGLAGANLAGTIVLTGLGTFPFVMTP